MNSDMNKVRQVRGKFGEEYTARQLEQKRKERKKCSEFQQKRKSHRSSPCGIS